jgi:ubiquinone biosynthesis protein COQ9
MTDDVPLAELRPQLVAAMLPHVPFDGWSAAARDAGARDMGLDTDIAALTLPDAASMADAYTLRADALMAVAMAEAGTATMKVRDRIRFAVRSRLEAAASEKEAVRRTLAVLAMPQNAVMAARTLWRTADAMWRAAGDMATDYNHYTKRAILGGVYSATLLYWLDDGSDGHAATWEFLDRRIDGIMRFEKTKARLLDAMGNLPDPARFLGRLRYPAR